MRVVSLSSLLAAFTALAWFTRPATSELTASGRLFPAATGVFDPSKWRVQESNYCAAPPTCAVCDASCGDFRQTYPSELANYSSAHFYTRGDNRTVMLSVDQYPIHNTNAPRPRVELMETKGRQAGMWDSTDQSAYHSLNVTGALVAFMEQTKKLVIAQIFSQTNACVNFTSPSTPYTKTGPQVMVWLEANADDPSTASIVTNAWSWPGGHLRPPFVTLNSTYVVGSKYTIGILVGGGQLQFFSNSLTTPVYTTPVPVTCSDLVFKTGNYYQSNISTEPQTSNSQLVLYKVLVGHTGGVLP